VQRQPVILGLSLSMFGSGYANEGSSTGKLLQSKSIETKLNGAKAWHVRYRSKDVNDVAHEGHRDRDCSCEARRIQGPPCTDGFPMFPAPGNPLRKPRSQRQ
jgi:hypothetical protein